jgi:DNA-binding NarL/FixJ family response regulator
MPSEEQKLKVLLADDHPIVRDGLRLLINAQPDMEVGGEAPDSTALVRTAEACRPDVAIIDVAMPVDGGAKATEHLLRNCPDVKVLALSAHEESSYVDEMLAAGASGYVGKRAAPGELLLAIRRVAAGDSYLDPGIHRTSRADLSTREESVLRLVARGYVMKEIAAALNVTVRTVETYRERAMEKAMLRSRADVVRFAAERGWLTAWAPNVAPASPGDPRHTRTPP